MKNLYSFYAQHLHIHSCYEPGASMEGHIYHASKLGMKHIWFTDHDIRMGRKPTEVDSFDFESGLTELNSSESEYGFKVSDSVKGTVEHCSDNAYRGDGCMKMQVKSDGVEWSAVSATLFSHGKSHCVSLLSEVEISFAYKTDINAPENKRLIFDFKLSERPPELTCAHILYVLGSTVGLEEKHTLVIPIDSSSDWICRKFDLSSDAKRASGGLDNVFDTVTVRLESRNKEKATAYIDCFHKKVGLTAQQTHDRQKQLAAQIGNKYGVTPFVATEISRAGMHKNCFSTKIPLLDYVACNYDVSHHDACRHVLAHDGVFSLNHPFVGYKRKDLSELDINAEVDKIAQNFIDNACFGATLLEVGFPEGRYLPLECHLRLWDTLALHGCFLTGYGCSDSHSIASGWYSGNNFATWLGVRGGEPADEEHFVEAMRAGRAYTGNPVVIDGAVLLQTEKGVPMGGVCVVRSETVEKVNFYAEKMRSDWTLRWIVDGKKLKEIPLCDGAVSEEIILEVDSPIRFARAEIYSSDGTLLLLTNPVYFVRADLITLEIPLQRRYCI